MEDLLSLVVLVLYFVISASASKKKKERKRAARQAERSQPVQFEQAFERAFSHMAEQLEQKKAPDTQAQPRPAEPMNAYGEGEDPCHADMLGEERASVQVKTVSQHQMAEAAEGEDPCHVGGAPHEMQMDDVVSVEHSPIFDTENPEAFAQDVLRGVIMSEILTRPSARRRPGGMKRGA